MACASSSAGCKAGQGCGHPDLCARDWAGRRAGAQAGWLAGWQGSMRGRGRHSGRLRISAWVRPGRLHASLAHGGGGRSPAPLPRRLCWPRALWPPRLRDQREGQSKLWHATSPAGFAPLVTQGRAPSLQLGSRGPLPSCRQGCWGCQRGAPVPAGQTGGKHALRDVCSGQRAGGLAAAGWAALTLQKLDLPGELALDVLRRRGAAPRRCLCLSLLRRCLFALQRQEQAAVG